MARGNPFNEQRKKPAVAISTNIYRTPIESDRDAVSFAALNLAKWEAEALRTFADKLQAYRSTPEGGPFYISVTVARPFTEVKPDDPNWKPEPYRQPQTVTPDTLPASWFKSYNADKNRMEYRDATGNVYVFNTMTGGMVMVRMVVNGVQKFVCRNGHPLDTETSWCSKCEQQVNDPFNDAEVMKLKEEMDAKRRVEQERKRELKAADPTGRFSGLEI